ncbi:FG-GAP-like repeat-containing protein [Fluviicola sp.]|uniref:FG-GAP-like repeat-containing protein n=1 Tax=Fluviicola sp. TaxID=1917219 RepID=UPI003D2C6767
MKINFTFFLLLGMPWLSQAQNTCATASLITAGTYVVTAVDGTEIPTLICAGNGTGQTAAEWYKYIPTADYTINLTTDLAATAGVDTRFHVYSGTCGAPVCVAGDDDGGSGLTSTASFNVTTGTTYIICFDNRWSSTGFSFELTEHPVVVPVTPPITFTANTFPSISGTYGLASTDMNGDFLDDIVTVSASSVQILYQQISGAYVTTNIPTSTTMFQPSWSMAIGDIDKNGFNDMLYGSGNGVTFMKANATGTAYTEVSGSEYIFCQRTNFVDINNDGNLDAFSCHDIDPNVYYLNDGSGNLIYHQGGLGDHPEGGNYGSIWTDYDNDGDQDLFIAKCRGGSSTAKINELHRNDGGGVFTDVSAASNMADPIQTWSSAWNDFNNDGWMDAAIGASSTDDGTHKLMKNNGDGTFSNVTAGSGWDTNPSLNIEHVSFDFDNDGFADVLGGGNKIMFGNGDMTFDPVVYAFSSGSVGDMNNDGFLDIRNGNTIYMSDKNSNNWITINLQGIQSNSNGIGARVEIYGSWGKQIRDIRSGDGFKYMNTLNAHFGIGTATGIDSLFIKWPSGQIDQVNNPTINAPITIVEGSHPLSLLEVDGKKITLYPNPTTDYLTIENFDLLGATSIEIYTQLGERVLETQKKDSKISLTGLVSGRYFLVIKTKNGQKYSESFIKM